MSDMLCRILLDQDANEVLGLLQNCSLPGSREPPLQVLFSCWMEHALETQGEFQLRMCALALTRLLAAKHPALQTIMVRPRFVPMQFWSCR
jgi:hypothetical protein